jgi:hypothetical protein
MAARSGPREILSMTAGATARGTAALLGLAEVEEALGECEALPLPLPVGDAVALVPEENALLAAAPALELSVDVELLPAEALKLAQARRVPLW